MSIMMYTLTTGTYLHASLQKQKYIFSQANFAWLSLHFPCSLVLAKVFVWVWVGLFAIVVYFIIMCLQILIQF